MFEKANSYYFVFILFSFLIGCFSPGMSPAGDDHFGQTQRKIDELETRTGSAGATGANIRIVVNKLSANMSEYTELDALWRYTDRDLVVANRPEAYAHSGLVIGVGTDRFNAEFNIVKQRLKSSEDITLFVVVSPGSTGTINIGREIMVPRFFYAGRFYQAVEYNFRQAGRFLEVTPFLLPSGLIEMQLSPVFSKFLTMGGDIEFTELATTVVAQPGQTIVIGGGSSSGEDVGTALFSYSKENEQGRTLITVTPFIQ
jgi:hypothetical protein